MNFFKFKKDQQFISQVVILSMLFGFTAGVVGQIFSNVYLDPWQNDYIYQDTFAVNVNQNIARPIPELRRVERFLGIQQDFEVNKSVQKVSPALVGIYLKKSSGSNLIDQAYLPSSLKTNGFILTNDGWIVTCGDFLKNSKKEDLSVAYAGGIFPVEEIIVDSVTGVIFIKISASNLPVIVLGDSKDISGGQLAVALNFLNNVFITTIKNNGYKQIESKEDFINSSEGFDKLFLLSDNLEKSYIGSPLVNLAGEVIGIIKEDLKGGVFTAVPINQFRSIILDVLRSGMVKRPYLGIKYIDLSQVVGFDGNLTGNLNKGALVYQKPISNSPAAKAGIEQFDIILSVYGQQLNKENNLAELIQQYKIGDKIEMSVLRAGKEIKYIATLSEIPN